MEETESKQILDRLNEPQILITILYLIAIAIGMIFNYAKYIIFGINIFDYCDLTDFILFPFSDVNILLLTLLITCICFVMFYIDLKLRDIFPNLFENKHISKSQYKVFSLLLSCLLFICFIFLVSEKYNERFYKNISKADNITIYTRDGNFNGKYVGKTRDVLFMYQNNELKIFPITSNINYYQIDDLD